MSRRASASLGGGGIDANKRATKYVSRELIGRLGTKADTKDIFYLRLLAIALGCALLMLLIVYWCTAVLGWGPMANGDHNLDLESPLAKVRAAHPLLLTCATFVNMCQFC
eukprot:28823-Prorocentrum_minimum.AAC.2